VKTALYTDLSAFGHQTPSGHAEQPSRLEAVLDGLRAPEFSELLHKTAPKASRKDLLRVHSADYIDQVLNTQIAENAIHALDADTFLSSGSAEAALRGAGAVCMAVDDVMSSKTQAAFCAMRPPGHHARPNAAMGFCLFSNIAIAALAALEKHGLHKVAIIDFDVHHGNGTQEALWDVPGSLFISLHQQDHYPGTGRADETGGLGEVLNLPMPDGTSSCDWMQVFHSEVVSRIRQYQPELIFVSAGFDAHVDDPLGGFQLLADDFAVIASVLGDLAHEYANSRLVSVLEGGYHLPALKSSSSKFIDALLRC